MIIDTSALIAVLTDEEGRDAFLDAIIAERGGIPAPACVEFLRVASNQRFGLREKAKEMLDFLKLSDRMTHKPAELSGGEKQRVAVARALINHPSVILADEPSGSLDSHNKEELHQLFFELRKEFNQTFVIVTHNEELANMADRKLVMVDGLISE